MASKIIRAFLLVANCVCVGVNWINAYNGSTIACMSIGFNVGVVILLAIQFNNEKD